MLIEILSAASAGAAMVVAVVVVAAAAALTQRHQTAACHSSRPFTTIVAAALLRAGENSALAGQDSSRSYLDAVEIYGLGAVDFIIFLAIMVKDKPNSIRTYDEDGFRKRAACLCVRNELEDEILLVTSSGNRERWIVPGGGLEPNEDSSAAAVREVMEEAGVIGKLARCLGSFEHPERRHRTSVYVLNVTEELKEWEDSHSRQRRWFKLDDAIAELSVHKPAQCKYVRLLCKRDNQTMAGSISQAKVIPESNQNNKE